MTASVVFDHVTARDRASRLSATWQARRAELLKQACEFVVAQRSVGVSGRRARKAASRKFRNRSLGGGKRLSLSPKTMDRIWYRWVTVREEEVFALRYIAGRHIDIDPLLLRLIVSSCLRESKTVSEILTEYSDSDNKTKVSTLYRALPARAINGFVHAERTLLRRRDTAAKAPLKIDSELRALRTKAESSLLGGDSASSSEQKRVQS